MFNHKKDFNIACHGDLRYLVLKKWQSDPRLMHCLTTRHGGVSQGHLSSLNLGFNRGDLHENVLENYRRVCSVMHTDVDDLVLLKQVHETNVIKIEAGTANKGLMHNLPLQTGDGMYTKDPKITLVTHYADCVPLLFYAPDYSIIGMAHAGWRGTVGGIAGVFIEKWINDEHIPVEAIQVVIGPSIGSCCFQVDQSVADIFMTKWPQNSFIQYNHSIHKYHIDLWAYNKFILMKVGIKEENIFISGLCTSCHEDLFFSHRKSNGKRGTLGAFMALRTVGDE